MQFWRNNKATIGKLLVNQIAITLFSLMLSYFILVNNFTKFFGGLFTMGFYWYLIYTLMWKEGGRQRIRADSGREAPMPYLGFTIGLAANGINLLMAIFNLLYRVFDIGVLSFGNIVARLSENMYIGWWQMLMPNNPTAHFLIILPGIAVAGGAYLLGYRNFYLSSLFGVKRGPDGKPVKRRR